KNTGGPGNLSYDLVSYAGAVTPILAGSIAGNQSVCTGEVPAIQLANTTTPVVGTCTYISNYFWQSSTDSTVWTTIPGATASNYTIPSGLAATTWYRRGSIDYCNTVTTLPVKVTVYSSAPGTQTVYGNGNWICYGYSSVSFTGYKGYYIEPLLSFDTRNRYNNGTAPSLASGYQGCLMPATNMSVSMKRTNIPAGTYQLNINYEDDGLSFLVNGVTVFNGSTNTSLQTNVWTGTINPTDNVEFQWVQNGSGSAVQVTFSLVTPAPLVVGTISGNMTLCTGQIPQTGFANAIAPTSGCSILPTGYQWQNSTDSLNWFNIAGANFANYTETSAINSTTWYRRSVTDQCGNSAFGNSVKIKVDNAVYGNPSVFPTNQWNFYTYTGYNSLTTYSGYYVEAPNSFATFPTRFTKTQSPSFASGYQGCQVPVTNYTVSAKRTGFISSTTGVYQIDIADLDDVGTLYIDGVSVYTKGCCVSAGSPITNIYTGPLNTGQSVEWLWLAGPGGNNSALTITELASVPTALNGGTVGGTQTICSGDIPVAFTSVTAPSGACYLKNYKWQKSTDGGTTWIDLANTNVAAYAPIQSVYVNTQYRRMTTDVCSNPAYSNVVTVTIQNTFPGNPATYGSNQWNIYTYDDNTFGLYIGYYVNPNMTFDTRPALPYSDAYSYSTNLPPSAAPGYLGCQQTSTQWSAWARRQGVTTPGYYSIDFIYHDDDVFLSVNGTSVFQHVGGCCDAHSAVWTGYLDASSQLDVKWVNYNGPGDMGIKLNYLGATSPSNLLAGTLSCSPSSFCPNDYPILTSGTPATSTCFVTYQWQSSPDNVVWSNIGGATSLNFTSTTPLGTSTYYRRGAFDACGGGPVFTPACFITTSSPPTQPTAGNGFWNNLVYYSNDFTTNFYGYYTEASLSFLTTNKFAATSPPSVSPSYVGCQLGSQYYSIRMLRTGFTPGTYQIDVNYHDDDVYLLVNGILINQHIGWGDAHINFWTGNLGATDIVELRYYNNNGPGELRATITTVPLTGSVTASIIAGNQTICNGATAVGLTQTTAFSSMCFLTTQWQSSLNNISYSNIPGATSATYSPGALTQTTYFRRVDSDACGRSANSNVITVTVNPAVNPGTIGSPQTVCNGSAISPFSETGAASGGNGTFTYQWQSSTDNITFANIVGATSNTYSSGTLGTTTYFRRTVTSCGGSNNTSSIAVTIPPATAITTQPVNYTDCSGATATFSVVAVGNGLTYQWMESTNLGISFSAMPGATSYSVTKVITGSMVANFYQYKVVVSATCTPASVTSNAATLNTGNPTFPTQPASTTTCNNGNASFNVSATGTGITYQWQINLSGTWTNLTNTGVYTGVNTSTLVLTNVNTSFSANQYRSNVTTSTCGTPTATAVATLTVQPSITGNTISGNTDICSGSTDVLTGSPFATLNGGGGVAAASYTHQWKNSTDNVSFNNIAGATSVNYTTPALTQTMYYQRVSSTSACTGTTSSTSTAFTVTVVKFVTQPANVSVCPGNTASFSVTTSPGTFTYKWQEFNSSWNNIVSAAGPNATGGTYSGYNSGSLSIAGITNAMSAFQYRVIVTSGITNCTSSAASLTSNGIQPAITVQPSDAAICNGGGNISVPLTSTGNGLSYVWQVKPPAAGSFSTITNGSLYNGTTTSNLIVLSPGTSFNGYQYKAIVSGNCAPSATSNIITISIYSSVTINTVSSPQRICSGDSPSLLIGSTPSGGNGSYTYQWQSSPDNSTWTSIGGATLINYQPPALAVNTYYRRNVISATCNTNNSTGILISVDPPTTVSVQPAVTTFTCPTVPVNISITGSGQNLSYQWQLSTDNGSTWNDIISNVLYGNFTTATLTVKQASLAYNGYQYRVRVSGDCGGGSSVVFSNASTLNVYTSPTITVTPSSAAICAGTSTTLVASGANTFAWSPGGLTGASQTLSPASTTIYTVTGTNTTTTCSASTTVTVNVNSNPTAFNVGGGGAYCSGGTGPAVTLAGSQIGVSYQLKLGGTNTGSPVLGTGAAISFGVQNSAGTYTVLATNSTTSCFVTMTGSTAVSINTLPSMTSATTSNTCSGFSSGLALTANIASTFSWTLGTNTGALSGASASSGTSLNQTLTNPSNTTAGSIVYNVTPTSTPGSCAGSPVGVTVTVNPAPSVTNSPATTICSGLSPSVTLISSIASNFTWTLGANTGSITGASAGSGATINQVLTNPSSSSAGSIVYIVTPSSSSNSCPGSPFSITVTVNPYTYTWTGTTNSSWTTGTNWVCGTAPGASTHDVVIPNTTIQPIIPATPTVIVRDISITGNAETLSVAGSGTLQVYGNWSNSGSFIANNSTVEFMGTAAQVISRAGSTETFYNLKVNKASNTLTVGSTTSINISGNGSLNIAAGTFDAAGRSITLKSSAPVTNLDQTARLSEVLGAFINSNNLTVERYLPIHASYMTTGSSPVSVTYHATMLAPAVIGITAANWADDIKIVGGPVGSGFAAPNITSYSSISNYSEFSVGQSGINGGWRYILQGSTALQVGNGYRVSAGFNRINETLKVTGTPVIGNFNKFITYTAGATQGWNLIGNPYACEINYDVFNAANNSKIEAGLYILDPLNNSVGSQNNTYFYYIAGIGVSIDPRATARPSLSSKYIPSSQAFFVKAKPTSTSYSLSFTESMKVNASVYGNFRMDNPDLVRLNLTDGITTDQTVVYFTYGATDAFDPDFDAVKVTTGGLIVSSHAPGTNLEMAINGLSEIKDVFMPLKIESKSTKEHSFTIVQYENNQDKKLYVFDKLLDKSFEISEGTKIDFQNVSNGTNDRFFITSTAKNVVTGYRNESVFEKKMSIMPNPYSNGSLTVEIRGNGSENGKIEICDIKGKVVKNIPIQGQSNGSSVFNIEYLITDISAGTYIVKYKSQTEYFQQKLVIVK
ncbi:MAG: T9SS type A sorting domain-containing protein, partial [Opitutaceae bacterium]|nr:T9SS type A sorting domain-containing protein [Cytophagales bacterium]